MSVRKFPAQIERLEVKKIKVNPMSAKAVDNEKADGNNGQKNPDRSEFCYRCVCLILISLFVWSLGLTLIIFGITNDLEDLLILGPIFLVAGVGFIVMLLFLVKPIIQNRNTIKPSNNRPNQLNEAISSDLSKIPPTPTAFQLYEEDKIIHVPSPTGLPAVENPVIPVFSYPNDPAEQWKMSDKSGDDLMERPTGLKDISDTMSRYMKRYGVHIRSLCCNSITNMDLYSPALMAATGCRSGDICYNKHIYGIKRAYPGSAGITTFK